MHKNSKSTTKPWITCLILLLICGSIQGQNRLAQKADSLLLCNHYLPAIENFKTLRDTALARHQYSIAHGYTNKICESQWKQGMLEEAYRTADLLVKNPGISKYHKVEALINLSAINRIRGKYQIAQQHLTEASTLLGSPTSRQDSALMGHIYYHKAYVSTEGGFYDLSESYCEKAAETFKSLYGEDCKEVADAYHLWMIPLLAKNKVRESENLYARAFSIRNRIFGLSHPQTIRFIPGMITFNSNAGKEVHVEFTRHLADRCPAIFALLISYFGQYHTDLAKGLDVAGILSFFTENYPEAIEYYRRSQGMIRATYTEEIPQLIYAYSDIGKCHYHLNEIHDAKRNFQLGVSKLQEYGYKKHPRLTAAYHGLASCYFRMGLYDSALTASQHSLEANFLEFLSSGVQDIPTVEHHAMHDLYALESLGLKGRICQQLYEESGDPKFLKISSESYQLYDDILEENRKTGEYFDRLYLSEYTRKVFEEAARTNILLYQLQGDPQYLERAFSYSDKTKAATVSEAQQEAIAKRKADIPEPLLEEEARLRKNLSYLETKVIESRSFSANKLSVNRWQEAYSTEKTCIITW